MHPGTPGFSYNAHVFVQRLSGWFVVGARNLVLLVLVFAPLVCLRFCQIRHAQSMHVAAADLLCEGEAPLADSAFLHDIQQLLSALTEFVPAVTVAAFALAIHAYDGRAPLPLRETARRVPAPPPRLRFA